MTESVFFHCLSPVFSLMVEFILAVICLLIFSYFGFAGVDKAALCVLLEICFVVFYSDKWFPFGCFINSILEVKPLCDFLVAGHNALGYL